MKNNLDRIKWLKSQEKWHSKKEGAWHKSQAAHYKKALCKIYTITFLVQETFNKHRHAIAQSVITNNTLFSSFFRHGK